VDCQGLAGAARSKAWTEGLLYGFVDEGREVLSWGWEYGIEVVDEVVVRAGYAHVEVPVGGLLAAIRTTENNKRKPGIRCWVVVVVGGGGPRATGAFRLDDVI
jgi:hypothetical protein